MSLKSLFNKPRGPDLPAQSEPVEEVELVEEDAAEAARRERKKIVRGGRRATILSGIMSALKKRLGE